MRGEDSEDRECRAKGGKVAKQSRAHVEKEFHGAHAKNSPDATLKRGGGPIFRKSGGKIAAAAGFATGGAITGGAKAPSMGRPGRKRGGGVGADLNPLTSADKPSKPKGRTIMSESEKTP